MPTNTLFLDAAFGRPTPRRPVWMMRQAGRYLPQYQAVRSRYEFLELCKTPEAAAEVSIQPYDIFGVDAIIYFCDILVPCEAMGMELTFNEGHGPQFPKPLRTAADLEAMRPACAKEKTPFIAETLSLIRRRTEDAVPVLGFAGAPWTLACYMIEGGGSRNFEHVKTLMWNEPKALHALLQTLTDTVVDYLALQIEEGGAHGFQLFDTWGGILSPKAWREFSLPYCRQIFERLKSDTVPGIFYMKGGAPVLEDMITSGARVVSVDWMTELSRAREQAAGRVALQGNLDPVTLYASPDVIRSETLAMLESMDGVPGYIVNLGHGLLPTIPVEHVRTFVETVQSQPLHETV